MSCLYHLYRTFSFFSLQCWGWNPGITHTRHVLCHELPRSGRIRQPSRCASQQMVLFPGTAVLRVRQRAGQGPMGAGSTAPVNPTLRSLYICACERTLLTNLCSNQLLILCWWGDTSPPSPVLALRSTKNPEQVLASLHPALPLGEEHAPRLPRAMLSVRWMGPTLPTCSVASSRPLQGRALETGVGSMGT